LNTLKHGRSLFAHFQIPDAFADKELDVLHWDGSQWQELEIVFVEDENAYWAVVESYNPGLFILIERVQAES